MSLYLQQLLIISYLWIPPILLCLSFLFGIFISLYSVNSHTLYTNGMCFNSGYDKLQDDDLVDGIGVSVCSFLGLLTITYFKLELKQTFYQSAHNIWILFIFMFLSMYFLHWRMSTSFKESILIKFIYWTLLLLTVSTTIAYIYEVLSNPHIILCNMNCMRYILLFYSIMVGVNIIDFFLYGTNSSLIPKYNQFLMLIQSCFFFLIAVLVVNLFEFIPNINLFEFIPNTLLEQTAKHSPESAFMISIFIIGVCSLLIAISLSAQYGVYGNLTRGMSAILIPLSLFICLLCAAKIITHVTAKEQIKSHIYNGQIQIIKHAEE